MFLLRYSRRGRSSEAARIICSASRYSAAMPQSGASFGREIRSDDTGVRVDSAPGWVSARTGATVATPLTWREVTPKLDPASFTLATVPKRVARQKTDPWAGFAAAAQPLPQSQDTPKTRRRA